MGHVNPHYNPEWKKVHDHHVAERARLEKERDRLVAAGKMNSDVYRQVKANFDRHYQASLASLKMQHATVQDYAAWLFNEFDVSMGGRVPPDAGQ